MFPFMVPCDESTHYLIPTALECDFRFPYISENVTCCGLILLGSPSLSELDPELEIWLQKGPTLLFNLRSNKVSDTTLSRSLATAMRILLDQDPRVQILWELRPDRGNETKEASIDDILSKETQSERVRIRGWLKAEPGAMLRSGLIVCSVHHGGADSYYEAVKYGPPPAYPMISPAYFSRYSCLIVRNSFSNITLVRMLESHLGHSLFPSIRFTTADEYIVLVYHKSSYRFGLIPTTSPIEWKIWALESIEANIRHQKPIPIPRKGASENYR
jgi:hypothetical protein